MIKAENKRDEYEKKLELLKAEDKEEIKKAYHVENNLFLVCLRSTKDF